MTATGDTMRSALRSAGAIVMMAAIYEMLARSGQFPAALLPTLPTIGATFASMLADGTMFGHVAGTLTRVLLGFSMAVAMMFWKVILPGAFPFVIAGLRQAFVRAWIAVVGAEMLAASDWGLGWVIFDAKEFLNADIMLASLAAIGFIGFAFERLVFGALERITVIRWGMMQTAKG
jgi:ABC-type nitrate/sulfonate/bicarbonate transport system permease component